MESSDLLEKEEEQCHHHRVGDTFSWHDIAVSVKTSRFSSSRKQILRHVNGHVAAGELVAIIGPSGAGKSTLLDVLAGRSLRQSGTEGSIRYRQEVIDTRGVRDISSYVPQEDALLGVLTVRETLRYAHRLASSQGGYKDSQDGIDLIIKDFGLESCADTPKIGTPISRGISGGQKRRAAIAASLVTQPRILFLDEPTSGLDSAASYHVIASLRRHAQQSGLMVIASIHQPNFQTFSLFDKVLLLAQGGPCFFGSPNNLSVTFEPAGVRPISLHENVADYAIEAVNADFGDDKEDKLAQIAKLQELHLTQVRSSHADTEAAGRILGERKTSRSALNTLVSHTSILFERTLKNYIRNPLAYGVRAAMYVGMGLLMATTWIRIGTSAESVDNRLSVYFFTVAFLGFMSVAGIPAYLEERNVYRSERANGLYGTLPYVIAQTAAVVPFLSACAIVFALIVYWAIGLHSGAGHFFIFLGYLILALLAAEFQSLLIAAILPIFIAALAIAAFMNGFWMVVQGYFIRANSLPDFWYYWATQIDYQRWSFNILAINDLRGLVFQCSQVAGGQCSCRYPSALASQCQFTGDDVLNSLDLNWTPYGLAAGILLAIIFVFRLAFFLVLHWQSR